MNKLCLRMAFLVALGLGSVSQAQTLTISNGAGQPTSVSVIPPHLLSRGNLILTIGNLDNCCLGRGATGVAISRDPLPASTLPMLLELDSFWYQITGTLVQSFMQPNLIEISSGSWSNCRRANGAALSINPPAPILTLSGSANQRIALEPMPFVIQYLPGFDSVRLRSRTGDVVCDGQVQGPVAPLIFSSGFENP